MTIKTLLAAATLFAAAFALPAFAADPTPNDGAAGAQPNEAEMMKQMMAMAQPGENHKLLAGLAGHWNYTVKFWMAPGAPPSTSKGSAVSTMMMGGRYLTDDVTGKMEMPGPDGKLKEMQFKGMGVTAYDNVKKKFISTWVDNMGTGVVVSEGDYDPSTKTFNYHAEEEMVPGMVTKVRETLQLADTDHHSLAWYEDHGGQETKTMEITYTRAK